MNTLDGRFGYPPPGGGHPSRAPTGAVAAFFINHPEHHVPFVYHLCTEKKPRYTAADKQLSSNRSFVYFVYRFSTWRSREEVLQNGAPCRTALTMISYDQR
jgi:hypothetical protein